MYAMKEESKIKPVALCIFRKGDRILVSESYDEKKQRTYYRPLGGSMELGEYSWEAVRREIKRELGEEIKNLLFIGPTEVIQRNEDGLNHQIIFMFEGEFVNRKVYRQEALEGVYNNGHTLKAVWKPLNDFKQKKSMLYPSGLLEFLESYADEGFD